MPVGIDAFSAAARSALGEIMDWEMSDPRFATFDTEGLSFDFYLHGEVDSLNMLDIDYNITSKLKIRTGLESLMHNNMPMTLQNLYDSIHETSPA